MTIHDINFDNDLPCLNGTHLVSLIDAFLDYHRARNQRTTVKGYRSKLICFANWWSELGPRRNWVLSPDDLSVYPTYLEGLGWGWRSRNDAIRRLRQMFRWAHQRGHLAIDFSVYVPRMKGGAPVRMPVRIDDLAKLLNVCWRMSYPLRNRAVIATLAGTGLRREECASLRIEDVTMFADGSGYLSPPVTKNDKPRLVAFDAATGEYIRQWLDVLDCDAGPLFPSRKGGAALSPDGLYKIILDAAQLAGVNVETHDLRRLFATTFARQLPGDGYGRLLQVQLGHESFATTAIYCQQQAEDVRAALVAKPASPLALLRAESN